MRRAAPGRPVVSMRLASEAVCAAGAPLHPDWNRVNTSSLPTCRYPRPAPVRAARVGAVEHLHTVLFVLHTQT